MHNVSDSTTPVIVSAVRTPIGRYLGGLSSFTAPQLGAMVIRDAVTRAGVDPSEVEEVIMGQVVQGGSGQAPARQALIHAGLPPSIPALTINKVCGSGLKAVMLASQAIKAGDAECIVAGGQEAMSNAPHYVYGMRAGIKAGNQTMVDGMIHDGLWDSFGCCHMGEYAEYTAEKAGVSRADQDAFAYDSHRKAVAAADAGKFKAEILPVQAPGKGGHTTVSADESPRRDTTAETLAKLKPAFRKDGGTVTAGNAPGLNDGASALTPPAAPSSPPTARTASGCSVMGTGLNGTGTTTCADRATSRVPSPMAMPRRTARLWTGEARLAPTEAGPASGFIR